MDAFFKKLHFLFFSYLFGRILKINKSVGVYSHNTMKVIIPFFPSAFPKFECNVCRNLI